jgi:predicted Fe-S protein YdhL (DUF1289 family)
MNNCLYCNIPLKPIKNDYPGRKYHKKCWFEKKERDEWEFMKTEEYKEIQKHIQNEINIIREQNKNVDNNKLNLFNLI